MPATRFLPELIPTLFERVAKNLAENWSEDFSGFRILSSKNWCLRRETDIACHNTSDETMLEKAIAILAKEDYLLEWYNQIPVASGLLNSTADRRAALDLARVFVSRGRRQTEEIIYHRALWMNLLDWGKLQ